MILILTDEKDIHADAVQKELDARGAAYVRVDPGAFPASMRMAAAQAGTRSSRRLRREAESLDLEDVSCVWYRRPSRPKAHAGLSDAFATQLAEEDSLHVLNDLWHSLDCPWVPAQPLALRLAAYKLRQLRIAARLGFDIPDTLLTNDPAEVIDFYNRHEGKVINKLAGPYLPTGPQANSLGRYTELVSRRDMGHVDQVRYCPMFFQALVEKRSELRITVIGSQVFAVQIESQNSQRTRLDWRHYDWAHTPHSCFELPEAIADSCRRLVAELSLCYGAIDVILTEDGRYVFLEINPNGQYLWMEIITGAPLSGALCDLLIRKSQCP